MSTRRLVAPDLRSLIDAHPCGPINRSNLLELRQMGADRLAQLPKPASAAAALVKADKLGAPEIMPPP